MLHWLLQPLAVDWVITVHLGSGIVCSEPYLQNFLWDIVLIYQQIEHLGTLWLPMYDFGQLFSLFIGLSSFVEHFSLFCHQTSLLCYKSSQLETVYVRQQGDVLLSKADVAVFVKTPIWQELQIAIHWLLLWLLKVNPVFPILFILRHFNIFVRVN